MIVKNYRKKPVVITAMQWDGDTYYREEWNKIFGEGHVLEIDFGKGEIYIPTLEGTMTANKGDYIIRGIKGEIYPCKPDIFELTYEEATDDDD